MKTKQRSGSLRFEVTIDKLVYGGAGLGRHEGKVVFVPFTAPGDRVEVRVEEEKKNYMRATLIRILSPGANRQEPVCPHFGSCGGCQWQHLDYAHQLESKRLVLEELIHHRLPDAKELQIRMTPSPERLGYRSRARIQLHGMGDAARVGFFQLHTHRVEDVESCPLFHPTLNQALSSVRQSRGEASIDASVQALDLICAPEDGSWRSAATQSYSEEEDSGMLATESERPETPPTLIERRIGGSIYSVRPDAFFQANESMTPVLLERITDLAVGSRMGSALDLFAGVGLFTLPLAHQYESVVAIEKSDVAHQLCIQNAHRAGLSNVRALCSDALRWMVEAAVLAPPSFDLVVLDPPRLGAGAGVMQRLVEWTPERIIYISCDPNTLLRDLQVLSPKYYEIDYIEGLDLFPQTYHFETVVRLHRR